MHVEQQCYNNKTANLINYPEEKNVTYVRTYVQVRSKGKSGMQDL